jgi:heme-degrading monooxygenase HmoA
MIARTWRGRTPEAKAEEYLEYLEKTGLKNYRATPGNKGVFVFRRVVGGEAEFLLLTLWESMEAIKEFAGHDPERAVYYPEDEHFLLELEPNVNHYDVLVQR